MVSFLENTALPKIQPQICFQYVDDTLLIVKHSKIYKAQQSTSDSFHKIHFTMEMENDQKILFLDV